MEQLSQLRAGPKPVGRAPGCGAEAGGEVGSRSEITPDGVACDRTRCSSDARGGAHGDRGEARRLGARSLRFLLGAANLAFERAVRHPSERHDVQETSANRSVAVRATAYLAPGRSAVCQPTVSHGFVIL
jgi:hypothetical protein